MQKSQELGSDEIEMQEKENISQKYSFFNIFLSENKEVVQEIIQKNHINGQEIDLTQNQEETPSYCIIKKQYRQRKQKKKILLLIHNQIERLFRSKFIAIINQTKIFIY
ncbi:hypothetical protein PPERSA_12310 [Pseudocohnilembus persalinus]|uniref:Uncharacterized protein n=1 Tax=Pseudocohnilembus persalinus TaxID=266149 RepID=A0A0V0R911_PSEPJ|nr:hypothetical protein PPERSA_12310 [Pseudocohnilembus persalinus]|eukprot:KRX10982.1 hypothetical protein PPERSA_12310 [Pseudocohnilembus persalinus]